MPTTARQQLSLIVAATLVFFTNLGGARLWDDDEPKNAQCAREMLEGGNWVVPVFNGELRYDKPVLIYWLLMSAYEVFGDNEFAARFWSAVAAVLTTLATNHIGRAMFTPRVGLWAGWMLATSLMFVVAGRAATPDSVMMLCTTLAMLAFVQGTWAARKTLAGADRLGDFLPQTWIGMASVWAAMALGVLAKGPVAVVLPSLVLFVYVVVVRQALTQPATSSLAQRFTGIVSPVAWGEAGWRLRPFTGLLMLALIAGPWYLLVGLRTEGDWLAGFLGRHNISRYLSTMENHSGPVFYYVPAVLFGFFPWSVFLPQALTACRRQMRQSPLWAAYGFLGCWVGVWIGFFSLSGTKLPSYVTPTYPALAIATAAWFENWLSGAEQVSRWWLRQSVITLAGVGVLIAVLLPIVVHFILPGEMALAVVGLPLIIGGIFAIRCLFTNPHRAAMALAGTSLVFIVTLFSFGAVRASRHQNSAVLIDFLRGTSRAELAAFDFTVPSLVYYSHDHVAQFSHAQDAVQHLESSPEAVVITYTRGYEDLKPRLPEGVVILARQQRFLRKSEVFVLGHAEQLASKARTDGR